MFDRHERAGLFSKLHLKTGYHQIQRRPLDTEKSAFKTNHGHFEFLVIVVGLRNALTTFQAHMNTIFRVCIDDFFVIYLDDISFLETTEKIIFGISDSYSE